MAMAGSQYHPPAVVPNSSLPWYMYKWLYWVYMYMYKWLYWVYKN
jgi:hypothetical protein